MIRIGKARLVDPDLDRHIQPLRRADLEIVKADVGREAMILQHHLARLRRQPVRHEPLQPHPIIHYFCSRNCTSRGRPRKRWPPSSVTVWPVSVGVAMMNRNAAMTWPT